MGDRSWLEFLTIAAQPAPDWPEPMPGGPATAMECAREELAELRSWARNAEALAAENARLRAGKWTPEEVHDICHNLHGVVDAPAFAKGCAEEQRRLYGCAPDADRVAALAEALAAAERLVEAYERRRMAERPPLIEPTEEEMDAEDALCIARAALAAAKARLPATGGA